MALKKLFSRIEAHLQHKLIVCIWKKMFFSYLNLTDSTRGMDSHNILSITSWSTPIQDSVASKTGYVTCLRYTTGYKWFVYSRQRLPHVSIVASMSLSVWRGGSHQIVYMYLSLLRIKPRDRQCCESLILWRKFCSVSLGTSVYNVPLNFELDSFREFVRSPN